MQLEFVLNGRPTKVSDVDPNTTVLAWLRQTGTTGTKEGCAEGECGACAIAWRVLGPDGSPRWEAINSCLVLVPALHGREVRTVEGVCRDGALHPVQACMAAAGGSQCGYCTPGFVVSMFAEYSRASEGPLDPESIAGNLCRCTGYRPIREALGTLATLRRKEPDRARADDLERPVTPLPSLAYETPAARFDRPTSLSEALALLTRHPDATLQSGGTDTVVEVNQRGVRRTHVIALDAIESLRSIESTDDAFVLGAGVPLAYLEEWLHAAGTELTILKQLLPLFSSRLIRTRATLGGNLGTASPISDSPPALLALDAEVELAREADGVKTRWVPLDGYFTAYRKTLRTSTEILTRVRIPRPSFAHQLFAKVSKRTLDDISAVAAGLALDADASGRITRARFAFGGVAATPLRLHATEALAVGRLWDDTTFATLAEHAMAQVTPLDDHRASAAYRRAMVGSLLRKLGTQREASRVTTPGGL